MADEVTLIVTLAIGAIITVIFYETRRKTWYLEVLSPRQHYEVGKERKVIAHMEIAGRHFHGVEAGKYKILLTYGDISTFGKPVLTGRLEEMYMKILVKTLVGKHLTTKLERLKFWEFIHKHIPSLSVKAYMLTGELVSPQEVLDLFWKGDARIDALTEMKRRGLIDPKVLWVKPYPPEDQLKEILTGVVTVPDIMLRHEEEYAQLANTQRDTLIQMDGGIANLLKEVILLERDIITSISDPIHVIGMIIADRVRKIQGLGLEQLAERGGIEGVIAAAKAVREHKNELVKALEAEVKPEELARIEQRLRKLEELEKRFEELTKGVAKPVVAEAK